MLLQAINPVTTLEVIDAIVMSDGATIGQAAGPLVTFDDTNNYLEITGCNVGIGTTSPSETLTITDNSSRPSLSLKSTGAYESLIFCDANQSSANTTLMNLQGRWDGNIVSAIRFRTGDDTVNKDNGYIELRTGDAGSISTKMVIDKDGQVGIGTSSPGYKLDVDGTFRCAEIAILAEGSKLATSAAPIADAEIANKKYVDDLLGSFDLAIAGDTGTGSVDEGQTLTVAGGDNISTVASAQSITVALDDDVELPGYLIANGRDLTNGFNWTKISPPDTLSWKSVCYGNNKFVAVAGSGTGNRVMTSEDGVTWTAGVSAADNTWNAVVYGKGLFVAVASSGADRIMISEDGITWTSVNATSNDWRAVRYGNGVFVAVSDTGTGNRVITSEDGITWTARTSASDNDWNGLAFGNGLFVAISSTGTGNRVMTSPDGITWTSRTSAVDNDWRDIIYGNGLFVVVGNTGTGNRVMTSPDGITWTARTSPADESWLSVDYGNGLFVAVSFSGSPRIMSSPDGITWALVTVENSGYVSVCYGNGTFVATATTGDRVAISGHPMVHLSPHNNIFQGERTFAGRAKLSGELNFDENKVANFGGGFADVTTARANRDDVRGINTIILTPGNSSNDTYSFDNLEAGGIYLVINDSSSIAAVLDDNFSNVVTIPAEEASLIYYNPDTFYNNMFKI